MIGEFDQRGGRVANVRQAFLVLMQVVNAINEDDLEAAGGLLGDLKNVKLPNSIEGIRWFMVASVEVTNERPQPALAAVDRAEMFQRDFPMVEYLRSVAFNQLGEHEKALKSAQKFIRLLGDDADAYLEMGDALEGLDRPDEALAAYRKGLDDTPESLDNLLALGLLLPDDKKGEIAERFAKLRRPQDDCETIAGEFLDAEDIDGNAVNS